MDRLCIVNIWLCYTDRLGEAAAAALPLLLDAVERQRNDRFRIEGPRRLHAAAYALARWALASRLGVNPSELRLGKASTGKPFLLEPVSTLTFNLSHSGGLAVCAIADGVRLGVDVEPVDRPELTPALLEGLLAPCEASRLTGLTVAPLQEALVALWTGKEAIAKAHGGGLSLPLATFVVPEHDGGVDMAQVPDADPPLWRLHQVRPDPRHRVALALAMPPSAPLEIRVADATSVIRDLVVPARTAGSA